MIRQLIVSILVIFICLSIYPEGVESGKVSDVYPTNYDDCVFPFTYNGKTYKNCTTDGDNGDILWCSLTTDYKGMFTYCYDFFNYSIDCRATYTVNGKEYSGCSILSKSSPYKQCKTDNPNYPLVYCPDAKKEARTEYKKRRRECKKEYKNISPDHTKCFSPSPFAVQVNITDDEKQAILDMHNQYRSADDAKSEAMFKLYWDDELANMAQTRGDMCAFDHDLASNRITPAYGWKNGQNMVMTNEIRNSLDSLIDMMLGAEKERFVYGTGCQPEGSCLHYTQAMISNITRVGCAHTHCVYRTFIERFLTCNYLQSQYQSTYATPYVQSTVAASKCPKTADGGLCDCKGKEKLCDYNNGEYLEYNTCKCVSPKKKRSIDLTHGRHRKPKRDTDEVVIRAPSGGKGNLEKRSINLMDRRHKKTKRDTEDVVIRAPSGGKGNLEKRSIHHDGKRIIH